MKLQDTWQIYIFLNDSERLINIMRVKKWNNNRHSIKLCLPLTKVFATAGQSNRQQILIQLQFGPDVNN
jgi:hypothetical protein